MKESEEIVIDRVSEDEGENEGLEKDQFSHENGETTQGSRKRAKKIVEVDPMEKMSAEFISVSPKKKDKFCNFPRQQEVQIQNFWKNLSTKESTSILVSVAQQLSCMLPFMDKKEL